MIFGGIGAVIITLLMISSVTATNVVQSNTSTTQKKDVYVDPKICITKGQLSRLQKTVQYINDPQDKAIVQQIIQTLQIKGKVTSNDIKDIAEKLHARRLFYTGFMHAYGGDGSVFGFPVHLLRFLIISTINFGYGSFGSMLIGVWNVQGGTSVAPGCTINGRIIFDNQPNKGIALLGFGVWGQSIWDQRLIGSISGIFALIIVSPA